MKLLTFTNSSVTSPDTCVSNSFFNKADNRSKCLETICYIKWKCYQDNFNYINYHIIEKLKPSVAIAYLRLMLPVLIHRLQLLWRLQDYRSMMSHKLQLLDHYRGIFVEFGLFYPRLAPLPQPIRHDHVVKPKMMQNRFFELSLKI